MGPLFINTISRKAAAERVQNWLEYATKKLGFQQDEVPKSIFIPRVDLEDALKEFEKFDELKRKASGIRIHLTKNFPMDGIHDNLQLACVVVPTVQGSKDEVTGRFNHIDAIIKIPASRKAGGARALTAGVGDSGHTETIYDFTSPCPADCRGTTKWEQDSIS